MVARLCFADASEVAAWVCFSQAESKLATAVQVVAPFVVFAALKSLLVVGVAAVRLDALAFLFLRSDSKKRSHELKITQKSKNARPT